MDVVVEADGDESVDEEVRTDGGEDAAGGALSFASDEVEERTRSVLDALPGRLVFATGAAAGSALTVVAFVVYSLYF